MGGNEAGPAISEDGKSVFSGVFCEPDMGDVGLQVGRNLYIGGKFI